MMHFLELARSRLYRRRSWRARLFSESVCRTPPNMNIQTHLIFISNQSKHEIFFSIFVIPPIHFAPSPPILRSCRKRKRLPLRRSANLIWCSLTRGKTRWFAPLFADFLSHQFLSLHIRRTDTVSTCIMVLSCPLRSDFRFQRSYKCRQ